MAKTLKDTRYTALPRAVLAEEQLVAADGNAQEGRSPFDFLDKLDDGRIDQHHINKAVAHIGKAGVEPQDKDGFYHLACARARLGIVLARQLKREGKM